VPRRWDIVCVFITLLGSRCSALAARFTLLGSRCSVHAARLTLLGSRCSAHAARLTLLGSRCSAHAAQPMAVLSPPPTPLPLSVHCSGSTRRGVSPTPVAERAALRKVWAGTNARPRHGAQRWGVQRHDALERGAKVLRVGKDFPVLVGEATTPRPKVGKAHAPVTARGHSKGIWNGFEGNLEWIRMGGLGGTFLGEFGTRGLATCWCKWVWPHLLAAAAAAAVLLRVGCGPPARGEGRGSNRVLPLPTAIDCLQLSPIRCYLLHVRGWTGGGRGERDERHAAPAHRRCRRRRPVAVRLRGDRGEETIRPYSYLSV
jgi:hypothetical protein